MVKQILPKAGEAILALFNKLGGNMNNVLGSRSNITFLGKGKSPEGLIDMDINIEAVGTLGKDKVLKELESSIGYLTAGKLNDVQANKLLQNMQRIDEVFNPKQVANITDLGTGTRNLDAEGIASLRTTQELEKNKPIFDKAMQSAAKESEAMRKAGLDPSNLDDYKKAEEMGIISSSDDLVRQLDDSFRPNENLPSLGELRKTQGKINIDEIDEIIKETDDIIRPKGDYMTDEGVMASETILPMRSGNQGAMTVKRANAREFLVESLKKDTLDPATSGFGKTNLNDIVSAEDVKFITEGGGGIGGDPLVLVEKYFGPRIVELIPNERMTPKFINRLLTNVRDAAGRAPDDPRFDRFTATLINEDIPFAEGGRAGFMAGGIGKFSKAQVLIQRLKNTIKDSKNKTDELSVYVNETFPGFIKEIKANPKLAENENVWKTLGLDLPKDQRFVVYSDDTVDFYKQSEGSSNIAYLERFMKKHPFLSREDALRIIKMEPEDQVLEITRLQVLNNRTKNAKGGLAKILEV